MTNENFFDALSENYDGMISFTDAVEKKKLVLKGFTNDKITCAADLGCGTGVDSIALSKLGLKVTSFDISKGMINKAKQNADHENTKINFINKSITEIGEEHFNKYDLIVSLGNSLANLNSDQLEISIQIMKNMLRKNGKVLLQILNYIPILKDKKKIINITGDKNFQFVRFYDIMDDWLQFNVLRYSIDNPTEHNLISTKIYPHIFSDFVKLLENAGFQKINFFGGLNKSSLDKNLSKDLVISAEV